MTASSSCSRAVADLLRLATLCFQYSEKVAGEPDVSDVAFCHWLVMRSVAEKWQAAGSTALDPVNDEALTAALRFMHTRAHLAEIGEALGMYAAAAVSFHVGSCDCATAVLIRDITLFRVLDQTGVNLPPESFPAVLRMAVRA